MGPWDNSTTRLLGQTTGIGDNCRVGVMQQTKFIVWLQTRPSFDMSAMHVRYIYSALHWHDE